MSLMRCRLCGKIFSEGGKNNICPQCIKRLNDMYGLVHEYMRDHEEEDFDIYKLAEDVGVSTADIQALVELGYIERDLGLYGKNETDRSRLAHAFQAELDKMRKEKTVFYGGEIYSRGSEYSRDKNDGVRTVRRR